MVLAFVLFAVDLYAPTHGALTIGGIVAFLFGSLILINSNVDPVFQIAPGAIAAVVVGLGAYAVFVVTALVRDRRRRSLVGGESVVGVLAVARTPLTPRGLVFLEGEIWQATSQAGPVAAGQSVRVTAREGLSLVVTPVAEPAGLAKEAPSP
jgi:membrane-bound serine protease (ClpP class)